ncbi:MAG: MFS transporter [Opitutaceae bacterium]|nr:MFS transporter [Opitutaceae bacterium]MBP9911892.1 MFS transporter [Opitutaceae bacterium]
MQWALACLSLSMLLASLGTSIANVGLPTLAQAFAASFQDVQWVVLAYLLAITTLIVSAGRLGDLTGHRRLLLAGIGLFTVASVLCGLAPTLWLLIVARAAQGLGAAIMMALTMAFVGAAVPKERIGRAMGLLGTMSAIGTALGPSLGGVLIDGFGWRAIFLINVPLGLLTLLLARHHLPVDRVESKTGRTGFDPVGTLLLALTLAAYALAMTLGRGHFGPLNLSLLVAAVIGVGLFVFVEARAAAPLVRLAMFRDPILSASLAMSALVSTVLMATLVVGPFYLSRGLGLNAALVGIVMSVGPLVAALTGVPAGRLVDRLGAQFMTIVGLLGIAAGSVSLFVIPASLGIPGYLAPLIVITAGYALFQTANNTAVMSDLRPDQRGVISGLLNLSRNLGLITGASVMGAVFALAAGTPDIMTARPEAVAAGMRITFAVAAVLIVVAIALAVRSRALAARAKAIIKNGVIAAIMMGVLVWTNAAHAGASVPGTSAPTPADPYPLSAAGWGSEVGPGLFASRWVEDWTGMRAAGNAPALKAMPLGDETSLTLSAEVRLRYDSFANAQLLRGDDYQQGLARGILGADLRFNPNFRVYGEIGTGRVEGRRAAASASLQNDASLQQLFADVRTHVGSTLVGAMVGRQEFADGPRQLLSVGDGSNLHRTWNGVRLYVHAERVRLGAFDFRATRLGREAFDERIDHAERLQGFNMSLIVARDPKGSDTFLDPFWIHGTNPVFRSGGLTGPDDRDTYGVRLWGKRGALKFDWTLAHQSGEYLNRDIDAWGLFAVQSLALSAKGWKPRLTTHLDVASGGGAYGTGTQRGFNQLYASSNYLGDGRFLSLSNLLLIAPGISATPTPATSLAIEYGFARRLAEHDAAYAGGMRTYPGTQNVPGRDIGGLLRFTGNWSATAHVALFCSYEHLSAGDVLQRVQLPSGSYGYVGTTLRY